MASAPAGDGTTTPPAEAVAVVEGDPPEPPDLTVVCDPLTYAGIGYRVLGIEDASAAGLLHLDGDGALLDVCFEVLRFPPYPTMDALLGRSRTPGWARGRQASR